jgi:hypothetical protein
MSALYQQQQALLERQLQILGRLDQGIRYIHPGDTRAIVRSAHATGIEL